MSGVRLPAGLLNSSCLPEPVFTPTTKADAGHDLPITVSQMWDLIGKDLTDEIIAKSMQLYEVASRRAEERGIIIADTKFEFAMIHGVLHVVDEISLPIRRGSGLRIHTRRAGVRKASTSSI